MINLSTPSDQLLAEIETDIQKVMWWLNKEKGNTTRSNKRKELARKYRARWAEEKKRFIGDTLEYKSALGNRWFCYDVVQKPAGAYDIMVGIDKFIYWETLGSIGAFLPQWWTDAETMTAHPSCLIYTSHFFQRFCERAKIQFRSREMVMSFVSELNYKPYKEDTDKDGNPILVFRMNHTGFAYAVRRKDNPHDRSNAWRTAFIRDTDKSAKFALRASYIRLRRVILTAARSAIFALRASYICASRKFERFAPREHMTGNAPCSSAEGV